VKVYNQVKAIGIIPARGGSKSIPKKNIKQLNGKLLVYYTIDSARSSNALDKIVVSTDDKEIANVSKKYGVDVMMRPKELATEHSPTEDALIHVLDVLKEKESYEPTIVLTLEPTSPLRREETIRGCIDLYRNTDADSVITVVETRTCFGQLINGKFKFLFKNQPRRRQDRESLFKESSTVYLTEVKILREKRLVLGDNLYGYVVSSAEAIDINDPWDFDIAEIMMNKKLSMEV